MAIVITIVVVMIVVTVYNNHPFPHIISYCWYKNVSYQAKVYLKSDFENFVLVHLSSK